MKFDGLRTKRRKTKKNDIFCAFLIFLLALGLKNANFHASPSGELKNMRTLKTRAIAHARKTVSFLQQCGGGNYSYAVYDARCNAWRASNATPYHQASFYRSQALVDVARHYLGMPPTQYDGGAWTDYI